MMKILDPQFGNNFVGRDYEVQELKVKIRNNGVVVVTGNRGIGKTNLMKVLEEFFKQEKDCHYIEYGSLFSKEISRIFSPEQTTTGFSSSISLLGIGGGAGKSWKPREPSDLENMEKSSEKIIFVENAHELKKEEIETIFSATHRNKQLKFVLEIAAPYIPDIKLKISSEHVIKLEELSNENIEKIVRRECPNFSSKIVKEIISLSAGYPYISGSLAYICDKKNDESEMLEFLEELKDEDMAWTLNRIHEEILKTFADNSRDVLKKLSVAPRVLTVDIIEAFCGEIDDALGDIIKRGIIRQKENMYRIYHPLFRDYLQKEQPIGLKNKKKLYCKAMEELKSKIDSIYMLLEVLDEPDIFQELIIITENYEAINSIGNQTFSWGEFNLAFLAWSQLIKRSRESKEKKWEATAVGNLGMFYHIMGEPDKALEFFETALKLNEELGRMEGISMWTGNIGVIYKSKGELDKALEYYEKTLSLNKEMNNKEGISIALGNIGVIYGIKGELDKALLYYKDALKLDIELESEEGMASDYGNMGNAFRAKGELDEALNYYQKALYKFEDMRNKKGVANQLGNIGAIYQTKEAFEKALIYHETAMKLNEEMGWKEGLAMNYGNLGVIYKNKGMFDKAIEYQEKSFRMNEEIGSKAGMAMTIANIGVINIITKKLDDALECLTTASKLNEEVGRKDGLAPNYMNIGVVYTLKNDLDKAIYYFEMASTVYNELGNALGKAQTLINIGDVYVLKGKKESAIDVYLEAQEFAIDYPFIFEDINSRINDLMGIKVK